MSGSKFAWVSLLQLYIKIPGIFMDEQNSQYIHTFLNFPPVCQVCEVVINVFFLLFHSSALCFKRISKFSKCCEWVCHDAHQRPKVSSVGMILSFQLYLVSAGWGEIKLWTLDLGSKNVYPQSYFMSPKIVFRCRECTVLHFTCGYTEFLVSYRGKRAFQLLIILVLLGKIN